MSKEIRTGLLLDFYGPLLTGRQQLCLDLYFNQDLSLAEIAGQEGIRREAEEKLGLFRRYRAQSGLLAKLSSAVEGGDQQEAQRLILAINALWDE